MSSPLVVGSGDFAPRNGKSAYLTVNFVSNFVQERSECENSVGLLHFQAKVDIISLILPCTNLTPVAEIWYHVAGMSTRR